VYAIAVASGNAVKLRVHTSVNIQTKTVKSSKQQEMLGHSSTLKRLIPYNASLESSDAAVSVHTCRYVLPDRPTFPVHELDSWLSERGTVERV
jgi:hypothetical protein